MPQRRRRCQFFLEIAVGLKEAKTFYEMETKTLYGNKANGRSHEDCLFRKFNAR